MPDAARGRTLLTGPSNSGKTRRTAALLDAWVAANGPAGVVVLDFAPEVWRDGRLLGGRIDRFTAVPDGAWHGVLDAHAPRSDGDDEAESLRLAADNAERARGLVAAAPEPSAVFVNDATIPFQHSDADPSLLTDFCGEAVAVLNAFESDELGTEDAVSAAERRALAHFTAWADRRRRLER
jgi:hypothetical protein